MARLQNKDYVIGDWIDSNCFDRPHLCRRTIDSFYRVLGSNGVFGFSGESGRFAGPFYLRARDLYLFLGGARQWHHAFFICVTGEVCSASVLRMGGDSRDRHRIYQCCSFVAFAHDVPAGCDIGLGFFGDVVNLRFSSDSSSSGLVVPRFSHF